MPKLLADENFKRQICTGLRRRVPSVHLVTVQEVGLGSAADPDVLEWAAQQNRVLLTHDARTVPTFAYERLREGRPLPGAVVVPVHLAIGQAIEDLILILEATEEDELTGRVVRLPL